MTRLVPAALVLVLLAGACGGGSEGNGPPPGRFIATSRSLTPTAHLFADPVAVRIDVVVNRKRLDPERVRLRVDFLPYRIIDGISRTREDFERFSRLTFRMTLRCLTVKCVPSRLASVLGAQEGRGERRTFRFEPARVVYDDAGTGTIRHLRRVWWPPLDSVSRLSAESTATPSIGSSPGAEFRSTLTPVLEPSYRMSASLLGGLLLAGAAAFLVLPGGLVLREVRRRRPETEDEPQLPPLERALLVVEWSGEHGVEEQRDALEALAWELDALGRQERARDVRELAWSPEAPPAERVAEVVVVVRQESDGAAA